MTRRRTTIPALGVCIGTLLLLLGDACAQPASATSPGKLDSAATPTPRGATAILTRVSPSHHRDKSIGEEDGQGVELTSRTAHDGQDDGSREGRLGPADESASQDEGRSDASASHHATHASSQAGGSAEEEMESLSSADGSRKARYGEISAAESSSGKSTSTKVVPERPVRLSRTNELTVATAKPALNDSKQDNRKNSENGTLEVSPDYGGTFARTASPSTTDEKLIDDETSSARGRESPELKRDPDAEATSGNRSTLPLELLARSEHKKNSTTDAEGMMMTVVASTEEDPSTLTSPRSTNEEKTAKSDEKRDKANKSDRKEVVPKLDSRKHENSTNLANLTDPGDAEGGDDRQSESRDRELTTMRGAQREDVPEIKKGALDPATTASEAFDLERTDSKKHDGVSLINDTYVNYKTQAEKEAGGANAGDQAADVDGSSRENGHPKEEVEVVENVTHQPILKIIDANNTAANRSRASELGGGQAEVVHKRGGLTAAGGDKDREVQKVFNASIEGADDGTTERKSMGRPESQVRALETTTLSAQLEEQSPSTPGVIPSSPIPQGRTIEFSGVNEFPSVEAKSTAATRLDAGLGTAPAVQSTRMITPKPYPYVKSTGSLEMMTRITPRPRSSSGDVAEETSAFENAIGREEESGKKLIVTEASVVLENSIQQQQQRQKLPNEKDLSEEPANFTTESSFAASAAVIPMTAGEIGPTNLETLSGKVSSAVKSAQRQEPRAKESDGAASSKSGEAAIAARDEGYDVTGNGITEVSSPPGEAGSRADEATTPSTVPKVLSSNTDIQTEPEEAMMIRSTFVVTESTIVPLDKDAAVTGASQSTTSMTPSAEGNATTVENTTESTPEVQHATLQLPANRSGEVASTTLNPDESSVPTTTSIEFEFVGLTEAIPSNTTEKSATGRTFKGQTMPTRITIPLTTTDSSSTRNSSAEEAPTTTARLEDSTEPVTTSEDESPTTTETVLSTSLNDTGEVRLLPPAVTGSSVQQQSNRTEIMRNEVTTSATDVTGAATDIDDLSASKGSSLDADITATPTPGTTALPPKPAITVLPATNVTKSPSAPPVSSLEPKVFENTPNSTESPDEYVTQDIQTMSQDEVTLLVKIVVEGTLQEVCPHLQDLRSALASVLTNGMDKPVSWKQIVIHQNPCLEPASSSPTSTDVPLTSILVYVVDEDCKFDAAMTKNLPSLYKVSHNFPVRIHKFVLVQETDSGNAIAVVVVSSVAFICLVLLAGLLFIMRKRQTRFNYGERCRPVSLDAYSLDSVSAYSSVRRKVTARTSKRSYGNPTFEDSSAIPSHPLNFTGLLSFCNDHNPINEEFSNIPQVSAKIDELPPGTEVKNRYANVIPLPETRVPLERLNNDAMTEYINASYVRGPKNATKYYIACQAPLDSTVTDFWRMIWEQQCKVIIMLTDLVENGVEKCTEYIPPSEVTDCHRLYGDFQVTLKKRETKEKYAISTLHLKNLENNTFREVFHIWYLWPVSGIESDGAGLIAVLLEARALQRGGPGPIVVHCSSGTGRTGTLIALDLGIRQYEITRTVDVPRVVYTIRRDRAGAVQTKEQYAFIYKALNLYATKLAGGVLEST